MGEVRWSAHQETQWRYHSLPLSLTVDLRGWRQRLAEKVAVSPVDEGASIASTSTGEDGGEGSSSEEDIDEATVSESMEAGGYHITSTVA